MKLTPEEVYKAVQGANAMRIDSGPLLVNWSTDELRGEPDNEWMFVQWHDDEGFEYSVRFNEAGLAFAEQVGLTIRLPDHEGDVCEIMLFQLIPMLKAAPEIKS